MAKNQVTLTFAGDSKSLDKVFDKVGSEAKDMASDVDKSGRDARAGFDKLSDGADRGEQRVIGLRDAFTGTSDVMNGFRTGDIPLMLTGIGDLASAVANFAGPLLGALATKLGITTALVKVKTVAMTALNAVMKANPLMLVITALALLATGFVVAYKNSETFRNIVKGAMDVVKVAINAVKSAVESIVDAIVAAKDHPVVKLLVSFFTIQFNAIKKVVEGVISVIRDITDAVVDAKDSKALQLIAGVFSSVFGRIRDSVGWVVDRINDVISAVQNALNWMSKLFSRGKTLSSGEFVEGIRDAGRAARGMAVGGVVRSPTFALIGEAGPEAVIPLSRPRRAAQVMAEAGLTGQRERNSAPSIRIDRMIVQDATDIYRVSSQLGRQLLMRTA